MPFTVAAVVVLFVCVCVSPYQFRRIVGLPFTYKSFCCCLSFTFSHLLHITNKNIWLLTFFYAAAPCRRACRFSCNVYIAFVSLSYCHLLTICLLDRLLFFFFSLWFFSYFFITLYTQVLHVYWYFVVLLTTVCCYCCCCFYRLSFSGGAHWVALSCIPFMRIWLPHFNDGLRSDSIAHTHSQLRWKYAPEDYFPFFKFFNI